MVLYALLAIIAVAGLFALAVLVLPKGEQMSAPAPDIRPREALPERPLRAEDVVAARLPVAVRGYRFAETDQLLDRLTDELRQRDEEIARLRGARPAAGGLAATNFTQPPDTEDFAPDRSSHE